MTKILRQASNLATQFDHFTQLPFARTIKLILLPIALASIIIAFQFEIHKDSKIEEVIDSTYSHFVEEYETAIYATSIYLLYCCVSLKFFAKRNIVLPYIIIVIIFFSAFFIENYTSNNKSTTTTTTTTTIAADRDSQKSKVGVISEIDEKQEYKDADKDADKDEDKDEVYQNDSTFTKKYAIALIAPLKIMSAEIMVYTMPPTHLYIALTILETADELRNILILEKFKFHEYYLTIFAFSIIVIIIITIQSPKLGFVSDSHNTGSNHDLCKETHHFEIFIFPLLLLILANILEYLIDDISQMKLVEAIREELGKLKDAIDAKKNAAAAITDGFNWSRFVIYSTSIFQICCNFITGFTLTLIIDLEISRKSTRTLFYILLQMTAFFIGGLVVNHIFTHKFEIGVNFILLLVAKFFTTSISPFITANLGKMNSHHFNLIKSVEEIISDGLSLLLNANDEMFPNFPILPFLLGLTGCLVTLVAFLHFKRQKKAKS